MDDLINEFLTETNESLQEIDLNLVTLEQNPNDKELLSNIFRLMHTIKGTCGFLGLPRLEKVAHHAENVLGKFRDGDLKVTPNYVTLIFESLDRIKLIIARIEEAGTEPEGDDSVLIEELDAVFEGRDANQGAASDGVVNESDSVSSESDIDDVFAMAVPADEIDEEIVEDVPAAAQEGKKSAPAASQSLRVNVDILENLMTMVSELVLTRNQLLQILRVQSESEFSGPLQRLNHVVSDLQEGVMKTRMQPIGNAWAKLPRIIRDISMELGKKIDLQMIGQDTELDRQVLDLIKDPLTHMVRNSGDHGIETPQDRIAAGKKETGTITLHAFHEGGHILIQIKDDGKGLSTEKIKQKAISNGVATEEELASMTTQQIQQFIFAAGFSTAEKVTAISGRGVGMDVVRTNIEKIGGSIELKSVEGQGSTFTIKIPLTLAIVSALIVESAKERFAIPQLAVKELVLVNKSSDNRIENIHGTPVLRLRDHLLPLISLSSVLKINHYNGIDPDTAPLINGHDSDLQDGLSEASARSMGNQYVVVTQVGAYEFGIIVDRVYDTEEIVVKPVSKVMKNIEFFSGNTILGDGTVIMILDPNGIARATGEVGSADRMEEARSVASSVRGPEKTSLLLFQAGPGAPKSVPLSLVSRLENINFAEVEHANQQYLIQYRGGLMPLTPMHQSIDLSNPDQHKPVLVFADQGRSLGLVVDEIIDITEHHVDLDLADARDGVVGSLVIAKKATDMVDVGYYLQKMNKDWFKNHKDVPFHNDNAEIRKGADRRRVLLVDDSPFFRNMLTPLLSIAGYDVTPVESPMEALKLSEAGQHYDVIISDIEMPEMNGFEFAEEIKKSDSWNEIPMVALTSHATPEDIDRGMKVGFDDYIAKFDRETLLAALEQTFTAERKGDIS